MAEKKYNPKGLPVAKRHDGKLDPEEAGKHQGAIQVGPVDKEEEQPPSP